MKKSYLIMAAIASLALVSCSDEEFVGNPELGPGQGKTAEIVFGSVGKGMTRADLTGEAAAEKLNNNFVVAGTKGDNPTSFVFDQYNVNWIANTANTTESNSNDWEYVGYTPATTTSLPAGAIQSIKYWDYAESQYDFAAYSLGEAIDHDNDNSTDDATATASAINANTKSYYIEGTADQLINCYISDLVTLYNKQESTDNTDPEHPVVSPAANEFGNVVTLKFRSLAAKIRLAFFETVPGYSVKEIEFYQSDADAETSTTNDTDPQNVITTPNPPTLYASTGVLPSGSGKMTVSFPTTGWDNRAETNYNKAHVEFEQATGVTASTTLKVDPLASFAGPDKMEDAADYIGRASNDATYAGGIDAATNAGKYFTILPYETGANLKLRIKYTLVSTDGSDEEITVDNATAIIPAELAKWSPNYAYTYIFKISDMTNGSTGFDGNGQVVTGLTPITLNAVVVDSEDGIQETITTVSDPSVTTYMAGKVVTEKDEYDRIVVNANESNEFTRPIYIVVNNGTTNVALTAGTNANLYTAKLVNTAPNTNTKSPINPISEESVENAIKYGVISTTTNTDDTYTVTDANGWNLVVTKVGDGNSVTDKLIGGVTAIPAEDSPTGNAVNVTCAKFVPTQEANDTKYYVFQYIKTAAVEGSYTAVAPATLEANKKYYTSNTGTGEFTATGNEIIVASGTTDYVATYYEKVVTYVPAQGSPLPAGTYYYYDPTDNNKNEDGYVQYTKTGTGEDPAHAGGYFTQNISYKAVEYGKLNAGTYYTSNRGAGKFVATGSEVIDAKNKYYTLDATPEPSDGEYMYKIIKVVP